ncbi:MAG: PilT/PilU family type 4a pilus ATPase [Burkholderiaceae bacterium]
MAMDRLLELMASKRASDLFLSVGSPVQIKLNGIAVPINQTKLDQASVEQLLREVITDRQWQDYEDEQELNVGYGLKGVGSFRFSLFRQRGSTAAVVRYIPGDVPSFESLSLPSILQEQIMAKRGLLLVVGATGSGKTTTLASLIDYRNHHKTGHILTLEDPIEFVFRNRMSIVNQRQIGTDTKSLRTALKNALRQAPDCILIGEIRDTDTMSAAIAYAQSGHLVLATLHANNASHALNRIVSFYSPENRHVLLSDLSTTLKAIVSQRLLKSVGGGRVPAVEVLLNTTHIAELIEQGRLSEIRDALVNSMTPGSQTFDQALIELLLAHKVTKEDALANCDSPTNLLWMLENRGNSTDDADSPVATAAVPQIVFPTLPVEQTTPTFATPAVDRRSALEGMTAATGPGAADAARARGATYPGSAGYGSTGGAAGTASGTAGAVTGAAGNGNAAGAALPRTAVTPATPGAGAPHLPGNPAGSQPGPQPRPQTADNGSDAPTPPPNAPHSATTPSGASYSDFLLNI